MSAGRGGRIALLLAASAASLDAQTHDPPEVRVRRLAPDGGGIRLDGRLDEAAWQGAQVIRGFRQREPHAGEPATEPTEVRLVFDGTTLFVGVLARDSRPDRLTARVLQRDRIAEAQSFQPGLRFRNDDVVAILIDPFHDRRGGFVFATNPAGAEFDALFSNDGQETNVDWRAVWRVVTARHEEGWSAEFEIPLRSIRYPTGAGAVWGFNVVRYVARKNEESLWVAWSRDNEGFHRVSLAGHLRGLDDLPRPGINLEAKPYLLGGGTRAADDGVITSTGELDLGLDVKWEVAPGLTLDATANTDFAQVEADDERVNLTRFNLFFPEKRDFFLENAGLFEFGWRSAFEPPPFMLFFSRRIGLTDDGAVPILGGGRLTGRLGRQSIGVLNVVTDDALDEPLTSHSVLRVRRDVGAAGYVGAMLTDRRSSEHANTAGGIDWLARPLPTLTLQGFAAATRSRGEGGDGLAARLAADYSTDKVAASLGHVFIGEEATAELGFVTRTGVHRTDWQLAVAPRPRMLGLRRVEFGLSGQHYASTAGGSVDLNVGPSFNPRWNDGSSIYVWYGAGYTRLDEGFDLSDRVFVPARRYDTQQLGWFAGTSPSKPVSFGTDGMLLWAYGGTLHSFSGRIETAPSPHFALAVRLTRNVADLPLGEFTADIASARFTVALSPRLVGNALVQYNSLENTVAANVRINYIFRPGSDLFLVFNERRGDERRLWEPGDRAALVKVTFLTRF